MMEFRCQYCGGKLRVAEKHAGRKGRCPRCKGRITVPQPAVAGPKSPEKTNELTLIDPPKQRGEAAPDVPDQQLVAEQRAEARRQEAGMLASLGIETQPEYSGQRRLPAPIDILLYPTSAAGLTSLAIIGGFSMLTYLLQRFVPFNVPLLGLPFFLLGVGVALYAGWYFAECVYDSAKGGTRAPLVFGGLASWGEMGSRVAYLVAVYVVYVLPVLVYGVFLGRIDAAFWGLLVWAIAFFPMGLLAIVILDSTSALNPFFLLGSIVRTFFAYIGLLIPLALLAGLFWVVPGLLAADEGQETSVPVALLGIASTTYLPFVMGHVLGRFYWRCRDKLDWGL